MSDDVGFDEQDKLVLIKYNYSLFLLLEVLDIMKQEV